MDNPPEPIAPDLPQQRHSASHAVDGATMVVTMDRIQHESVKDPPNLVRTNSFSLDRLLSHTDPGPAEETEAFVRLIYEQRRIDVSSERNDKISH
jgi:hypothetical protein